MLKNPLYKTGDLIFMRSEGSMAVGHKMHDLHRRVNRFKDDALENSHLSVLKHSKDLFSLKNSALAASHELSSQAHNFDAKDADRKELLELAKICQDIWEITSTLLEFSKRLESGSFANVTEEGMLSFSVDKSVSVLKEKFEIIRQLSLTHTGRVEAVFKTPAFKKFSTAIAITLAALGVFGGKDSGKPVHMDNVPSAGAKEKSGETNEVKKNEPKKERKKIKKRTPKPKLEKQTNQASGETGKKSQKKKTKKERPVGAKIIGQYVDKTNKLINDFYYGNKIRPEDIGGFARGQMEGGVASEDGEGEPDGEGGGEDGGVGNEKSSPLHSPSEVGSESSANMSNHGKFENGAFATVEHEFSLFGGDEESLWMTHMVARDKTESDFVVVPRQAKDFDLSDTRAKVVMDAIDVEEGGELALYTPINTTIGTVETNPPVPATINRDNRSIRFDGSAENVVVSYTIVKSGDSFGIPDNAQQSFDEANYDQEDLDVIKQLETADPSDRAEILRKYFSGFDYVLSKDIQDLFDQMPGTMSEKVGYFKIGDCDTLSQRAAAMLADAGKRAGVMSGVLETDDHLDANKPHAKLVYFDENNNPITFESTSPTRNQYIDLVLKPEHKQRLEEIIDSYQNDSDDDGHDSLYAEFYSALHDMLTSKNYGEFKDNSTAVKKVDNLIESVKNELEKTDAGKTLMAFLGALMVLSAVGVAGFGLYKTLRGATKAAEKGQLDELSRLINEKIDLLEGEQKQGDGEETKQDKLRKEEIEFAKNRVMEERYAGIFPWERFNSLSPEQQKTLILALSVDQVFLDEGVRRINFIAAWWARFKASESFERLRTQGLTTENLLREVDLQFSSPKIKAEIEREIPEKIEGIIKYGKDLARETFGGLEEKTGARKVTADVFFKKIGLELSGKSQQGESSSRRSRVGASGDFAGYTEYQPGSHDARSIDWSASARLGGRGKYVVKERELESGVQKPEKSVYLIINVFDPVYYQDTSELIRLVAFLSYIQHHPKEVGLAGIDFVANGKIVDRFPPITVARLNQRQAGFDAIHTVIQKIEKLRMDNFGNLARIMDKRQVATYTLQQNLQVLYGQPDNCDRGDATPLLIDFPYRNGRDSGVQHLGQVYKFVHEENEPQIDIFDNTEQTDPNWTGE
ncbi:MAG: hypothetical protein ACD_72C00251G0003 [uncultured bacterium]|nr:MAG: hypothetical protein ACD_72C00251G0003 [uncultured bacterium]